MSEQNTEKRPITPGKIKAPLRGVESAVVSSCLAFLQRGTIPRMVVLLTEESDEDSSSRTALVVDWRSRAYVGADRSLARGAAVHISYRSFIVRIFSASGGRSTATAH